MQFRIGLFIACITLFSSCEKAGVNPVYSDLSRSQASFTLENNIYPINSSDPDYISEASVQHVIAVPPAWSTAIYSSQVYDTTNFRGSMIVKRGKLLHYGQLPSDSLFLSFFTPGEHHFSVNAQNGYEVFCIDQSGVLWSTSELGGYQGDNKFRIISADPFYRNGTCCVKIKACFSCTVYHPAYGPRTLTNGFYEGFFENEE